MRDEEGGMREGGWGMRYRVIFRNIKHPRIELKTGEVVVIVPYGEKPEDVIKRHEIWIKNKIKFIEECLKRADKVKLFKREKSEFEKIINSLTETLGKELKVKINKIIIRKMKTKWASLSKNRNLTLNSLMIYLPLRLIKYIIYHELAHIFYRRHDSNFWKLISKKYKNYERYEKELFTYWFLICKKTNENT